jgi:uncharacterized protein YkwD
MENLFLLKRLSSKKLGAGLAAGALVAALAAAGVMSGANPSFARDGDKRSTAHEKKYLPPDPEIAAHAASLRDSESENLRALRLALYKEVNKARRSVGARQVERDAGFEAISIEHARDMVARTYMAHRSPEGDGPRERIMDKFPDFTGSAGENIAMRRIHPREDAQETALAAVEAWIDSPPHRKNLYEQRYGHVGLGAADNGRAVYIVMMLASEPSLRPLPEPEPETEPGPAPAGADASGL